MVNAYTFPNLPSVIDCAGGELRRMVVHHGIRPPIDVKEGTPFWHIGIKKLFIFNGTLWEAQTTITEEFNWSGSNKINTNYDFVEGTTRLWLADTVKRPGIQYYETPTRTINVWNKNLVPVNTPCAVEYRIAIIV